MGTFIVDAAGRYQDADEETLELFGVDRVTFLAAEVGDFAGPYRDLARSVWRRTMAAGGLVPTGEATIHRPDGTTVRVHYVRIERDGDGRIRISVARAGDGDGPPVVDRPSDVLERWRAAERGASDGSNGAPTDHDDAGDGAEWRTLYQHAVRDRLSRDGS